MPVYPGAFRKLFAARCATGDWDAVVMTHSAFTAIPVHPAHQAEHLTNLAATYRQALTAGPRGGSRTVKQLAKMIDAFETRAKTLLAHRTDDGVYWEHLDVDFIQIDEAHYFKNLGVPVRTDGFSVAASKRASDLDMKLDLLRKAGGKVAALFTGTPVSNSLLEMYVLQHYLHPERLDEVGLASADAWAANFVEFQTTVEVTPDGAGFRLKRRPVRFENVPELLTLFCEITDLRPPDSFAVKRPAGRHHNVVISSSPELRAFVADLAHRADNLHLVDAAEDNMLKICSDGRKAALDLGLVGITTGRPGKVGAVVANVARIYHDTAGLALPGDDPARPGGGFQIVFCDLGTPNADSSQVYGQIRSGLTGAGVPAGRIRFIHHATTDSAKAALFADCRAGKVAVLLGSTDKLGVGTNIQTRCIALHHVDAPWRPADVEQREGRALRPGNLNATVDLYRYVTEKSFDSFMWQALERKARFIGQVLSGQPAGRDVDDIGDATLSYAEVKALATGNPLLLELAEVNADVARLRQLATAHTRSTRRLRHSIAGWQEQITAKTRLAGDCDRIGATTAASTDPAWYTSTRQPIAESDVAGHLAQLVTETLIPAGSYPVAYWQDLRITFTATKQWREVRPHATIWAGRASLTVDLNAAWTAKGQHWRIEREITSAVTSASAAAGKLRAEITDLEQRIGDATRRIGEPFPHSAELEAARSRRDAIETAIREAAGEPPEPGSEPADEHSDDDVYVIDPLDADGEQERITIRLVASPPAMVPDDDFTAGIGDQPAEPEMIPPRAVTSGLAPRPPQSVAHPNALARLDGEPLSLFDRPEPGSGDQAAAGVGGGPGVRAGRVRAAAADAGGQDALFDLPSPATTADASRNRPRARRR